MNLIRTILKPFRPILTPLSTFLKNLIFLFNNKIEEHYISKEGINFYLDNLKYEIKEDLINLKRPLIASPIETIDKIIRDKVSIARLGDGEFELLFNRPIRFQTNDLKLMARLKEILISEKANIAIGVPYFFWNSVENCNLLTKTFTRNIISKRRRSYDKFINFEKQYYSTEFTQLYIAYDDEVDFNMEQYFDKIRSIWVDRDVTVIQGKGITREFRHNIFDNVRSIEYILGPAENAFDDYENILTSARDIDKSRLVIIILGPTATVLAYDLAIEGYQALDIGHTAKDYDFYKRGVSKSNENIVKFYAYD
jgi:glycosyltransferase family protein